ncbi:hypothetical protein EV191_110171 [Tamaricihabitans halophyticus]|uniref:Uncharacterized protein n=1 Tax=Tamaricihabitans halophyticus TaxID=1262583 RepID=A0A4R2QNI0_9PSEU|nr:hypothetical protein [Tamaricihabitans halophyticus]TCP48611.1 hypothetical protein EV191_110171 [Tamaricihabitans halophyticus]
MPVFLRILRVVLLVGGFAFLVLALAQEIFYAKGSGRLDVELTCTPDEFEPLVTVCSTDLMPNNSVFADIRIRDVLYAVIGIGFLLAALIVSLSGIRRALLPGPVRTGSAQLAAPMPAGPAAGVAYSPVQFPQPGQPGWSAPPGHGAPWSPDQPPR